MYKELEYKRLRTRLIIDKIKIDDELADQPALMQEAAECCSDAIQMRDSAKAAYDYAMAAVQSELRLKGIEDTGKAPSDKKVESDATLDPRALEAAAELEELKRQAAQWSALVTSFGEKGSSMRRIADMIVGGFITPNAAYKDRRAEMNEARQGTQAERAREGAPGRVRVKAPG